MKKKVNFPVYLVTFFLIFASASCSDDDIKTEVPEGGCYVHLFDGDNFKDDNIVVEGPGEFASMVSLPGSRKNWDDEADSFKSGQNTTVIFWFRPNFEGDSVIFEGGAEKAKIEEPRSMKIICNRN